MPRPKKDTADRRTEVVNIRYTKAQRLALESQAIAAGLSTSEFVRRMSLEGKVIIVQSRRLHHDVFVELKRIGNNINQLAHKFNQSGNPSPRIEHTREILEQILLREFDDDS
jgi:hypothetical protein